MPPRRRVPAPTPIDVEALRRKLADGKIVRVGISGSAQFPDGGTGRVRRIGDPAVDGEEFVQVEVSLNGTRDVLPFTPADLTPATRGRPPAAGSSDAAPGRVRSSARGGAAAGGRRSATRPARTQDGGGPLDENGSDLLGRTSATQAPRTTPDPAATVSTNGAASGPPAASAPPGGSSTGGVTSGGPSRAASSAGRNPGGPASGDPITAAARSAPATAGGSAEPAIPQTRVNRARSARGPRRAPAVSITIATSATEPTQWRIEARVGARVAVRASAVSPVRVWELVRMLHDDTLIRAVGSILDEQREAAQSRVDALSAELALVKAELDALPGAGH